MDQSPKRRRFLGRRVPPSLFGIALGLAGLAEAWHAAGPLLGTTQAIPSALSILDAALWLVLVVVCLAATIALGGWLTGQWMTGGIEPDALHAGYFLPTAAGGLIGADAAAQVQLHALAQASFGIGIVSWILLGSTILNRLFTAPRCHPRWCRRWRSNSAYPPLRGRRTSPWRARR
jgi:tellurite resistance protein TehA-like permease